MKFCMIRLTTVMPTQQQKPIRMALPPVLISFTILVFKPMAHMERTMKNLLNVFSGLKASIVTPIFRAIVVIKEANTK